MRQQLPPNTEQINDRQMLAIQRTTRQAAQAVNAFGPPPIAVGPVTFTVGQVVTLDHKLARQPMSWTPTDITGGYGLFRRVSWDDKTITIQSSNACTATFRVQ